MSAALIEFHFLNEMWLNKCERFSFFLCANHARPKETQKERKRKEKQIIIENVLAEYDDLYAFIDILGGAKKY